jgi:predicted nucleotidyltransferase component of viral defense system
MASSSAQGYVVLISRDEILAVADETGLTPQVVEKDHVLGWLLAGIDANASLSTCWVFKGGTCLKKCYFETYRFSEDLDFTLRDESHLADDFLRGQFAQIAEWLYENAGIEIPVDRLLFDVYENRSGRLACEGRIYYRGHFTRGKHNLPKIKLDLTADELLALPPERRPVLHPYSDLPTDGIRVGCYAYAEVFGEKVRALGERGRPRDLYDVINLYRNEVGISPVVIRDVLEQKCNYKGIAIPRFEDMEAYRPTLLTQWEPMLGHQLPSLPSIDTYWDALPAFFEWLEGETDTDLPALGAVTSDGVAVRPRYGQLGLRTTSGQSLEIIRFAAGNRLCVSLDYTSNDGRRATRVIEPYSLRRAQNGNVLLYAVRADDGQIRAYKISQINSASITDRVFRPRYAVELGPEQVLTEQPGDDSGAGKLGPLSNGRPATSRPSRGTTRRRGHTGSNGPTYVFRCAMCGKRFSRKKMSSSLNAHKSKDGWPCPGRTAIYETTKY